MTRLFHIRLTRGSGHVSAHAPSSRCVRRACAVVRNVALRPRSAGSSTRIVAAVAVVVVVVFHAAPHSAQSCPSLPRGVVPLAAVLEPRVRMDPDRFERHPCWPTGGITQLGPRTLSGRLLTSAHEAGGWVGGGWGALIRLSPPPATWSLLIARSNRAFPMHSLLIPPPSLLIPPPSLPIPLPTLSSTDGPPSTSSCAPTQLLVHTPMAIAPPTKLSGWGVGFRLHHPSRIYPSPSVGFPPPT